MVCKSILVLLNVCFVKNLDAEGARYMPEELSERASLPCKGVTENGVVVIG